ncbi:hypothetical protein O181_128095 [Austropuccinia psidii MF-1]|uniref:Uncharacterized protein n=1 Tax=Austropuccinia psidii MF-1 TaxID=1389203 RepID=A0A9Q3Q8N7_9BASI|nr:hypothetical protein [Austropuccinia psidii MF-1]
MEREAYSIRVGVKSIRSRSFSGLLGGYPSIHQGPRSRIGESEDEEGEGSMKEKDSEETKVAAALEAAPEPFETPNLHLSNQTLFSQAKPNFLRMMEKKTQFMEQLTKEVAPRDNPRAPAMKTPSMRVPVSFDGTQRYKLREFIQSCKLIFHNDPENFFSYRKKVLYTTLFLTGTTGKRFEPYLSNISTEYPLYLLNSWKLFEIQLFTLFGDPNEFWKA